MTLDPRAHFLRHCSQVNLAAAETGDVLLAETLLLLDDPPTAQDVVSILHGLKALASLRTQDPHQDFLVAAGRA